MSVIEPSPEIVYFTFLDEPDSVNSKSLSECMRYDSTVQIAFDSSLPLLYIDTFSESSNTSRFVLYENVRPFR